MITTVYNVSIPDYSYGSNSHNSTCRRTRLYYCVYYFVYSIYKSYTSVAYK